MNRIVSALSNFLEPEERECACGDLEEWRLSTPAAAANLLGLVARRQLAEWSRWGPWAALLAVSGLSGYFLSEVFARIETQISLQIGTYLHYGVSYQPGGVNLAQIIAYIATGTLGLLLASWACGFVLASLSRRTFWITSLFFYCIVRDSVFTQMALSGNIILKHGLFFASSRRLLPLDPVMIVCLGALAMGARRAWKASLPQSLGINCALLGAVLVVLLIWMESWFAAGFAHWSGQPYRATSFFSLQALPWMLGLSPVLFIPLLRDQRRNTTQFTT